MDRKARLLEHIDRAGAGIEIGPSHSPIAPKAEGFKVGIIDVKNRAQLVEKYREHKVDLARIEEVDFVWRGQSYRELTGKERHYDWIIASHVIEHVPDFVQFLADCSEILKPDGVLSLAVPDKRYCFDTFRPISSLSAVIDRHLVRPSKHSAGVIAEFMLNACSRNGQIAWDARIGGEPKFLSSIPDVQSHFHLARQGGVDIDPHAWCFTPSSFRLMIQDLGLLGLTLLRELAFAPTEGHEFFVSLSAASAAPPLPRLELLQRIRQELREV